MANKPSRTIPPGVRDPSRRWISNKVMQDHIQILKYGYETTGAKTEAVLWCKPGGGPPLHYHLAYSERFTARTGNLVVYVDGTKHVLTPGESATVKQGQVHRFTAEGEEEIEFSGEVLPSHPGFERGLYIMYGLANDGFADKEGLPRSPVHSALVASMSDMRFPGKMGWWMDGVIAVLAWWGRWTGEEERLLGRYWDN